MQEDQKSLHNAMSSHFPGRHGCMGGGFSVTLESHKEYGPGDDLQGMCVTVSHITGLLTPSYGEEVKRGQA